MDRHPRFRFVTAGDVEERAAPWGFRQPLSGPGTTDPERLLLVRVRMPAGHAHPFHRHPTLEEILYVLSGRAEQWVGRQARELGPGDVAHIPRDVVHGTWNAGEEDLVFLAVLAPAASAGPTVTVDVADEEPWRSLRGEGG